MAEALAVVGIVASIVQLVDFSSKILSHLDEFRSGAEEVPKSFRHIKVELPLLQDAFRLIKEAIDAGSVGNGTKRALLPAIQGCREQVAELDAILAKTLPGTGDSWHTRGKKAILSLNQDHRVESISKILRGYIGTLTFYYTVASPSFQPLTGSIVYDKQIAQPPHYFNVCP